MREQERLRLYALALALLPDETVAAELFMRSRNEAELRSAASRWRREQGLPERHSVSSLPALDPAQQDLALHLARRGERRRQTRRALAGLAGALLVLAAVLAPGLLLAQPGGLATDPAFSDLPLSRSHGRNGLHLSVYQAQAVPGAITVWWELKGRGAAELQDRMPNRLLLHADEAVAATSMELQAHRRDRLLGRSVFPVLIAPPSVSLLLQSNAGDTELAVAFAPLHLDHDPDALLYTLHKELLLTEIPVNLGRLHVGEHATTVEILFSDLSSLRIPYLLADGQLVPRAGVWETTRGPLRYDMVWHPIPPGTRQLEIGFRLDTWRLQSHTVEPGDLTFFDQWQVEGGRLRAQFRMDAHPDHVVSANVATRSGQWVQASVRPLSRSESLWVLEAPLLTWVVEQAPNGNWVERSIAVAVTDLDRIQLYAPQAVPDPSIVVHLR